MEAWGPRTGNVNHKKLDSECERRKMLTDKARGVGEEDLLIRPPKDIANGKQWKQDMPVKD